MRRGRFITFEGGEGCGKSTQVARLKEALEQAGQDVVLTREPGGTWLGEKIRFLLKDQDEEEPCDRAELLLFLAARAQLVRRVIRPALERGAWVVSDRFSDSTLAYQGYGRGLDLATLRLANDFACEGLAPDRTFLLDIDRATAARRLDKRQAELGAAADRIERAGDDFHERLRAGYAALAAAEPERIVRIDATRSREGVWEQIWNSIKPML